MTVNNPGVAAKLTVAETEVFSGTSPTTWTDLDLSAVVGANYAEVMLKVYSATANKGMAFRKKGDTDEFLEGVQFITGVACVHVYNAGRHYVVKVFTNAAGVIQWKHETASTVTIDVMGFIA